MGFNKRWLQTECLQLTLVITGWSFHLFVHLFFISNNQIHSYSKARSSIPTENKMWSWILENW